MIKRRPFGVWKSGAKNDRALGESAPLRHEGANAALGNSSLATAQTINDVLFAT